MKRPTRRQFLRAAAGLGAGIFVTDAFFEARGLTITRHEIPSPTLPPALDGLRIAQLSDLHLPCAAAERAVTAIADEAIEIVVITGDTIDRESRHLELVTPFVSRARGRLATYAVRGNNDHWAHVAEPDLARAYANAGALLLDNASAAVEVGDAKLQFVGLDDPAVGHPNIARAWRHADRELPTVWLLHTPGFIDRIDPTALELPRALVVLAGHTHGGQIRGPGCTPYAGKGSGRFTSGWYDAPLGPVYITRGIGTSVVPLRFLCPPELPIFTLRRRA
jgi:predicted MPP superfamily phosphohydrolase